MCQLQTINMTVSEIDEKNHQKLLENKQSG